ncbi:bifunctional riboflavin kinase/FAD synthetase [Pasteurellaceae bacterium LIM206]|nr:bifunctional riboflavin kinase/FAD synthetase [Pasteurellaceae bacterium LIM206]
MQLIRGMHNFHRQFGRCALTIGNFDGVHLGHQAILRHLRSKANALHLPMVVMLFEPQPREYFMGENAPARLMRLRDKLHYLAKEGVDYVICLRFNRRFARQSAASFIEDVLVNRLHVKFLSIGDDFRFGARRQGNFALLAEAGRKFGFEVEDNHTFSLAQLRVSSTSVRQALAEDNLVQAERLLGKPYSILGKVVHGQKLGRTIGFPTANIRLRRQVNPVKGVYAVRVKCSCGGVFEGVANVGQRPTVNGVKQILEVHLFDFNDNLYGQNISVEFCHKLRNEIKFPSFEELKLQIQKDVVNAKAFFADRA